MNERERQATLKALDALRLTPEYQALATGTATPQDLATIRRVQEMFAYRAAGRPGATPGQIEADFDRIEHEKRAFAEGYIPPWLVADGGWTFKTGSEARKGVRPEGWPEPPVDCVAVGSPPRILRLSDGYLLGEDGEWHEPERGGDVALCRAFGSRIIREYDAATLRPDGSWEPAPRDPNMRPDLAP